MSRGVSYGATETITNTKLHNLVDLGSVTNIVDADISASANIASSKLADITTGNKVRGTALGNLASIPSGSGLIPIANLPVLGSSMVSLVSIPNASLLPLTLTSWVDGAAMRNIQSMPSLAGQLAWYSVVSSLASGASVKFDGTSKFIGALSGTDYAAGDYLNSVSAQATTARAIDNLSYTKKKEIVLARGGTLRIKFDLTFSSGPAGLRGRVYRNGSAVGTEQNIGTYTTTTFSEDIGGWVTGDLCQLYTYRVDSSDSGTVSNFILNSLIPTTEYVSLD